MKRTAPTFNRLATQLVNHVLTTRAQLFDKFFGDKCRKIDRECGYPEFVSVSECDAAFRRGDIAGRIIKIYPEGCWSRNPDVFESEEESVTPFEQAWKDLVKRLALYSVLEQADVLSGIGRFGVLLLGFDDGLTMDLPVPGIDEAGQQITGVKPVKLIYARAFSESLVQVTKMQGDATNPRFGQPTMYSVSFSDPLDSAAVIGSAFGVTTSPADNNYHRNIVHWSRVIHLADNRVNSLIYGRPRLEVVWNRLLDLTKVAGGSAEMFWKGGFPGLSIQTQPNIDIANITFDKEATQKQIQEYQEGLSRYLATVGMEVKSLAVQLAEPGQHLESQLKLIGAATGVPWRVLFGSEQGQLASAQDSKNWNERLTRRQEKYVDPYILTPFIQRLIDVGVLPTPKTFGIEWPDLYTPTDTEKADIAQKKGLALASYTQAGADIVLPPYYFLTLVMGLSNAEANAAMSKAESEPLLPTLQTPAAPAADPGNQGGKKKSPANAP